VSLGDTGIQHPGISLSKIKELPLEEIQETLQSLIVKLNYAYRVGNMGMIHQINMAKETYTLAQQDKLDEMFGSNDEDIKGKIDIT